MMDYVYKSSNWPQMEEELKGRGVCIKVVREDMGVNEYERLLNITIEIFNAVVHFSRIITILVLQFQTFLMYMYIFYR